MLIYDPFLSPIEISNVKSHGLLKNTGRDLQFLLNRSTNPFINITGGPLSYRYEMFEIKVHFGIEDKLGSEHQVANKSFPIEIQVYGFNSEIYKNYSQAKHSPYGLIAVSILTMLDTLRTLTRGDGTGNPPLMENNFRPIMPTNGRFIRTNIKVNQVTDMNGQD
ncbi:hypothetical protein FSP39_000069 [Pinctada imbricata]|uniref:Alpha-carbonic anhydrase domain-containing protein n=1 Tax=Pinctada imbricata TaxID=66713 RepID=A0AA89C872_PINIB|nr:hypothetical protein FSP39_000069 [Pinctada imbricata]